MLRTPPDFSSIWILKNSFCNRRSVLSDGSFWNKLVASTLPKSIVDLLKPGNSRIQLDDFELAPLADWLTAKQTGGCALLLPVGNDNSVGGLTSTRCFAE